MSDVEHGPRERMVFSAAQLIRRQGVSATGMRDVVEHAQAPRGSLQHYFPGGKAQLVNEAVGWASDYAGRRVAMFMSRIASPTPSRLFAAMTKQWVDELSATDFAAGCPLAAATADCAGTVESTRVCVDAGFTTWRRAIESALGQMGVPAGRRTPLATLMLSALEGAILMARAEHDVRALRTVTRELAPLLDVDPSSFPR
jgi:AcrR family transcriptional regulator